MRTFSLLPRARHLALMLAALLHLAGVAAGPVLHRFAPEPAGSAHVLRGQGESEAPAAAHDELACAVCAAVGAHALPPAEGSLPLAAEAPARGFAAGAREHAAAVAPTLRARAPPALSC